MATEKTKLEVTTSFHSDVLRARRGHGAEKCIKQPPIVVSANLKIMIFFVQNLILFCPRYRHEDPEESICEGQINSKLSFKEDMVIQSLSEGINILRLAQAVRA